MTLYFILLPAFGNEKPRIISTCPGVTEIIFYLGIEDKLVGISNHCDYPEQIKNYTKCAGMSLDIEKIISLKPDYVIMMKGFRNGEEEILKSSGIKVIALNMSDINGIVTSIKILGKKFSSEKKAKEFETELYKLEKEINRKCCLVKRPEVYIETWGNPLMTVGNESFISDLIEISGGRNIFSHIKSANIQISSEELISRNPEIIIVAYPEKIETIKSREYLKTVSALKNNKVFKIHPDFMVRPGPRILEGIKILNRYLHGNAINE